MLAAPNRSRPAAPTYHPLVLIVCALATGIVADRWRPIAASAWWIIALAALAVWLPLWLRRRDELSSFAVLGSVLALSGAWHHVYWRLYSSDEIARFVREQSRPVYVEAIAAQSPRWVPAPTSTPLRTIPVGDQSDLLVWLTAVRDGPSMRSASGWASLEIGGLIDNVQAGDRIRIMAQASRPAPPLNPGEFNFAAHERTNRVGCRLFAEFPQSVEMIERCNQLSPRRWLSRIRGGGLNILRKYISGERAKLASAVLLGAREQLDANRNEGYLVTGTIHVLSISGLHVGILAAGFFVVLRTGLFSRRVTVIATIAVDLVVPSVLNPHGSASLVTSAKPPGLPTYLALSSLRI